MRAVSAPVTPLRTFSAFSERRRECRFRAGVGHGRACFDLAAPADSGRAVFDRAGKVGQIPNTPTTSGEIAVSADALACSQRHFRGGLVCRVRNATQPVTRQPEDAYEVRAASSATRFANRVRAGGRCSMVNRTMMARQTDQLGLRPIRADTAASTLRALRPVRIA